VLNGVVIDVKIVVFGLERKLFNIEVMMVVTVMMMIMMMIMMMMVVIMNTHIQTHVNVQQPDGDDGDGDDGDDGIMVVVTATSKG
jgi:hypothetical protein